MTAQIAVVVPVLNRPRNVATLIASWLEGTTSGVARLLFVASESDWAEQDAIRELGLTPLVIDSHGPGDFARKINAGFAATIEPLVLCGADDLRFHPGWAEAVLEFADQNPNVGVIGTDDLGNPTVRSGAHSTHPVVRRAYIDERGGTFDGTPGVVYHEGYDHQYVDTELCELAKRRGVWGFCSAAKVEHMHPFWHKGEMDDTYRRGLAEGHSDSRLFQRRLRAHLASRLVAV